MLRILYSATTCCKFAVDLCSGPYHAATRGPASHGWPNDPSTCSGFYIRPLRVVRHGLIPRQLAVGSLLPAGSVRKYAALYIHTLIENYILPDLRSYFCRAIIESYENTKKLPEKPFCTIQTR